MYARERLDATRNNNALRPLSNQGNSGKSESNNDDKHRFRNKSPRNELMRRCSFHNLGFFSVGKEDFFARREKLKYVRHVYFASERKNSGMIFPWRIELTGSYIRYIGRANRVILRQTCHTRSVQRVYNTYSLKVQESLWKILLKRKKKKVRKKRKRAYLLSRYNHVIIEIEIFLLSTCRTEYLL